jgi:hypothetical protein
MRSWLVVATLVSGCGHATSESTGEVTLLREYEPVVVAGSSASDERPRAPIQMLSGAELAALERDSLAPTADSAFKKPQKAPTGATLSVHARPDQSCTVRLSGGQDLGRAPFESKPIEAGHHTVVISCKAHKRYVHVVDVAPGEHEALLVAGKPQKRRHGRT